MKRKTPAKKSNTKRRRRESSDNSDAVYAPDRAARSRGSKPGDGEVLKPNPNYVVPDTDEDVDEETVESWTYEAEDAVQENLPTIEKVLDLRLGSEDAVGSATTVYNVEAGGDPDRGGHCQQYLIKWKKYSHLHNTWESDESLKEMKAKIKSKDLYIWFN